MKKLLFLVLFLLGTIHIKAEDQLDTYKGFTVECIDIIRTRCIDPHYKEAYLDTYREYILSLKLYIKALNNPNITLPQLQDIKNLLDSYMERVKKLNNNKRIWYAV